MKKGVQLSVLLLLMGTLLLCISGCREKDTVLPSDTGTNVTVETDGSRLEPVDYEGEKITFMTFGYDTGTLTSQMDLTGDYTGGVVEQAVVTRNLALEEKYNIEIAHLNVMRQQVVTEARTDYMNGDGVYNILLVPTANAMACGIEGIVQDTNQVPHIDLTQSYWYNDYNEFTQIHGKNFFILGDMNYTSWTSSYCIYFNITLANTWGIDAEEIYTLIRNGDWTFDAMASYSALVYNDTDGDNRKSVYDTYGFYSNSSCVDAFLAGVDMKFVSVESDGSLSIDFTQQFYDFYDKLCVFAQAPSSLYSDTGEFAEIDRGNFPDAFISNRAMFYCASLPVQNTTLRDAGFDYIFLPLPKLNEAQTKYYSWLHQYNSSSIAFMSRNQDSDMLGRIAEDMAYFSKKYVRPAYYDTLLEGYLASSPTFVEMLNYFVGSYSIDLASVLAEDIPLLSGAGGVIRSAVNANAGISSTLKRHQSSYQSTLNEICIKVQSKE